MEKDLVSILIPVYNREKIVKETIESAIRQTYQNIEIVICDNCSTDNTWEVLEMFANKDKRIRIFRNQSNVGPVKNWEKCIQYSKGEYVKFLFSDDLIGEKFIETCLPILKDNPDTGFVYTKTKIFSESTTIPINYRIGTSGFYNSNFFVEKHVLDYHKVPVSPGNALFRKADIEESLVIDIDNPFNLDFSLYGAGNDLLLYFYILEKHPNFYFLDEELSFFRSHNDSFTVSNNLRKYYEYAKYSFFKSSKNYKYLLSKQLARLTAVYPATIKSTGFGFNWYFLFKLICKRVSQVLLK